MRPKFFLYCLFSRPSLLLRGPSYPKKSKMSDFIVTVGVSKWVHPTGIFLLDTCRMVSGTHTSWGHRFSMSIAIGKWLNKNSQRYYLLGRTSRRFLWCSLSFHFWSSFNSWSSFRFQATLSCHRHSTLASQACEGLHQLWALLWLLSIAFTFLSTASATILSEHFLPTGVFYLALLPQIFDTTCFYQPAVLPWSLQGLMLILETQTRLICLFDSQQSTTLIFRKIPF